MTDYSWRVVPPGSTAQRELLATIAAALDVRVPADPRDLRCYWELHEARSKAVGKTCRRLLDDREADDGDVMQAVWDLRDQVRNMPPAYIPHSMATF
jgi:hypothetical protein